MNIRDVSINGVMCYEGLWSSDNLSQGTRRVNIMDLSRLVKLSEDEELADESINTITFTVAIYNEDYDEALSPEEVTVTIR